MAVDKSRRKYVRKSVQNADLVKAATLGKTTHPAKQATQPKPAPTAETPAIQIEKGNITMTKATENVAVEAAVETVEAIAAETNGVKAKLEATMETIKTTSANVAEKATGAFNDMQSRAKGALASTGGLAKETVAFQKSNFVALTTAGKIAAASVQQGASATMAFNKKNVEAVTAHAKALTTVRTPSAFFNMQRTFAAKQLEAVTAELPKVSAFWMKLASDVAAPLQQRAVKASEEVQARLAA